MKKLTKIILVQWYLFEAQEIPIVGHTAIVGANGAGKSSIIDAIQTVLAGGDKNRISLNKGSNERSSRTIREYCLGIVSDPNSNIRVESRDCANTYIALCFYDDETHEHLCAGVSIWGTATDAKESFEGYFITRGGTLSVEDFTEEHMEGATALPWNRVRERLLRRFTLGKDFQTTNSTLLLPTKGAGDFTRQFYTVMSAEPGMPSNPKTLVKSLLSAIAFKPIADPTLFVRQNMLDPSDINIRDLKASLDFWRELRDKANRTAQEIERLQTLEDMCQSVTETETDILLHDHASLAARIEECYEKASPAEDEWHVLNDEIDALATQIKEKTLEAESIRENLAEKEAIFRGQDNTVRKTNLKADLEREKTASVHLQQQVESRRSEDLRLAKVETSAEVLPHDLSASIQKYLPLISLAEELLGVDWLKSPQELDAAAVQIKASYENCAKPEMSRRLEQIGKQLYPLHEDMNQRGKIIARLAKDEAPLQDKTFGLIDLLKREKISPVPLCNLIDVKDEAWRATVEAVLGNIREALIVPPEKAKKAIRLYRHEGKEFRGAHVVNTTKTGEWLDKAQKGSLAEMVVTDDPHARAFINLRLGNIIRVDKESELLEHPRAATADLMLTTGGVTSMMREPRLLILGRANRKKQLARLKKVQDQQREESDRLTQKKSALSSAMSILDNFAWSCEQDFYTGKVRGKNAAQERIEQLETEIAMLEATEDAQLRTLIESLKNSLKELTLEADDKREQQGEKKERRGAIKTQIDTWQKMAEDLTQELQRTKEQNPLLDPADAADLLERLRMKHAGKEDAYHAVINEIDAHLKQRRKYLEKKREAVTQGLQEFLSISKGVQFLGEKEERTFEDFQDRSEFISREKRRFEETTLANYAKQADTALHDVESIFRDRFIGRLGERLKEVKDMIAGLNRILKNRMFHGEYYQFRAHPAQELKPVFDLAINFEDDRDAITAVGGLFDPVNDPTSPHQTAIEFIKQSFQDEDLGKRIQDYRNYFVFDVEMHNPDGQKVANLKHRIAKGSGGENMSPFYVAIGSSLASAYKITSRPGRKAYGGMNLAPFDEAFSKLDAANIYNCVEFLKEINLQVLLAAPDDKYMTLAAQMDTIIWITREGGLIDLETEYLTEKTHRMLLSDNPFAMPSVSSSESVAEQNIG